MAQKEAEELIPIKWEFTSLLASFFCGGGQSVHLLVPLKASPYFQQWLSGGEGNGKGIYTFASCGSETTVMKWPLRY